MEPVFEDVDGIGESTGTPTSTTSTTTKTSSTTSTTSSPSTVASNDRASLESEVEQLMDSVVMEAVIGAAAATSSSSSVEAPNTAGAAVTAGAGADLPAPPAPMTATPPPPGLQTQPVDVEMLSGSISSSSSPPSTPTDELSASSLLSSSSSPELNLNLNNNDTSAGPGPGDFDMTQLKDIDPAAVVEAVIGTALTDADSNGVLPTRNLLDVDLDVDSQGNVNVSANIIESPPVTSDIDVDTLDKIGGLGLAESDDISVSTSASSASSSTNTNRASSSANTIADTTSNDAVMSSVSAPSKELQQQQEYVDDSAPEVPNLRKIFKFAVPAIGVWLCSPLLSLIDTSSVGLLSGTTQQAALNPAVAVTDYGALLVAFMYTATTNLVAGTRANEAHLEDKVNTKIMLMKSLQLSAYVGLGLGSALIGLGPVLLRSIIGNDAINPAVFSAALRYVRVRALGMPAAVVIGSAQSACIGLQDIRSPMYVLIAAAVVNFLGDVIFVPMKGAWIGGAAGAAWATVFSQYAALAMFFKWLTTKSKAKNSEAGVNGGGNGKTINLTNAILELTTKSDEGKSRRKKFRRALAKFTTPSSPAANSDEVNETASTSTDETTDSVEVKKPRVPGRRLVSLFRRDNRKKNDNNPEPKKEQDFSVRGFLQGQRSELLSPATIEDAKVFWPYFIPVTTTSVGRVSAYISMSHVVSSALGTMSMAANQVILSVFYCLTPIADSLNLTAQSFLPAISRKKVSLERAAAIRQTSINFIKSGLLFSVGMVGAVGCIPFVSRYFTSDPLVIALVNSVVPILAGVFATHGTVCALEGVLLGQKDLNFLGKSYASFFFLVPYFMLRVKKAALQGATNVGLDTLWSVFFCYNAVRALMWVIRGKMLSDGARKEAEEALAE